MIKALIATLALSTLCIPQVEAFTFDKYHSDLEYTIEHLLEVTIDPAECHKGRYAGWISGDGIVVCAMNSPDRADVQDTLRHEGVHLAQRCLGYTTGAEGLIPIDSDDVAAGYREFPEMIASYPENQQDVEAEAWYVASLGSARYVDHLIRKHCSFAFE